MLKIFLLVILFSIGLTIICGGMAIPILKRLKAGQTILQYVKTHKEKNGTPTMGGLFFILPSVLVFLIFNGFSTRISIVALSIGLAYLVVGFIDDFIKIKFRKNEGLKPYQKIVFQLSIAILSGVFCYYNGLTFVYIPFIKTTLYLSWGIIPFSALIFLAITNSVNLTDGLDGLASSTSLTYLIFMCLLIFVETITFGYMYINKNEYHSLMLLSFSLMGGLLGFLLFNVNKAKVFMGDTGSLSLGGFIGAISIFSSNSFFIPILGIMFVLSSVSVIIQVIYFKFTKGKRIFLMSPYHHHLQLKGLSESQISYIYSIITCIMGISIVIFYL